MIKSVSTRVYKILLILRFFLYLIIDLATSCFVAAVPHQRDANALIHARMRIVTFLQLFYFCTDPVNFLYIYIQVDT